MNTFIAYLILGIALYILLKLLSLFDDFIKGRGLNDEFVISNYKLNEEEK